MNVDMLGVYEIFRPRDSQSNKTQCNSPKTVIFQRKNELPRVGLEPLEIWTPY